MPDKTIKQLQERLDQLKRDEDRLNEQIQQLQLAINELRAQHQNKTPLNKKSPD